MELQTILKKVVAKETLTAEELDFLDKHTADDANRIPKDRLDKEIKKREAAEAETASVKEKLEAMQAKLDELEAANMDEAQKAKLASDKEIAKLKKDIDEITAKNAAAEAKAAALERNAKIRELATARKFKDADYLDFRLKSQNVDLGDEKAVGDFFTELEKSAPHLFDSAAKPGTGTGGDGTPGGAGGNSVNLARLEELNKKTTFTNAEAAEFLKLTNEKNAAEAANKK